jgi:peptidoglycan/LPS O-acetylase OafA/YrhL
MHDPGHPDKAGATLSRVQNPTLQAVHRAVLVALAVCAVVVWSAGAPDAAREPDRRFALAALVLAAASILTRRAAPAIRPRPGHAKWLLASLLLAMGVALVGVALAIGGGPREVALLYVLGAAILALRPPPPLAEPS